MPLTGVAQTEKELTAELDKLKDAALVELKRGVNVCLESMLSRTPVWTGETVANYHVAIGSAGVAGYRAPVNTGDPGQTNKMALGVEPRRGANEALPRAEMSTVLSSLRKLADVVITNTVDDAKWDMVDNGAAPGGPPGAPLGADQRLRSPGGVSKVAQQTVRSNGNWK